MDFTNFNISSLPSVDVKNQLQENFERKKQSEEASIKLAQQKDYEIQLLEEQNQILNKNYESLYNQYNKLKDIYETQTKAYLEKQEEAKNSKKFNAIMLVVATIAALVAICGLVIQIIT